MLRWLAALLCLLLPAAGGAAEFVAIPALAARVTDLTGTLTPAQRDALEGAAAAIEREKGAQVAILLLPTTQPETIEQFGIRLAEAWRIGRQGSDDGVIVIVAKDDRRMRIEVGYGLEGAIPDALAKRIVDERMAPRFRQGDFAGGLDAAVASLGELIRGEALPPPASPSASGGDTAEGQGFFLLLVIVFASVLRSLLGLAGSLLAALLAGGLAWGLFASWFAAVIAAVLAFFFSFMRMDGGLGGGGFSSGGRGGGWSSGGGGGGFSGGGGSFGGGGSSGSW